MTNYNAVGITLGTRVNGELTVSGGPAANSAPTADVYLCWNTAVITKKSQLVEAVPFALKNALGQLAAG